MIIERKAAFLEELLQKMRLNATNTSFSVGFVPTMGYLHDGHLELVKKSKQTNSITVVSIFVNPTQFNNSADLIAYPRNTPNDLDKLEASNVDIVFLPDEAEIYGTNWSNRKYDLGELEHVLEGEFRPGHFQGVSNVVHRLLQIIRPNSLFMGQKDIQQCAVVARLLSMIEEFQVPKLHIVTTIRETSGLAMSSRNARLSTTEVQSSVALYKSLRSIANCIQEQLSVEESIASEISRLEELGFRVEYLSVRSALKLETEVNEHFKGTKAIVVAAWVGNVRLIDNILV